MGVGLQGRVHLACRVSSGPGLSSARAPCGLPRAQGPTDCRSSGAETLVSTGAAGQRSSTADPPGVVTAVLLVLQRTLVEPGPGRVLLLAGQGLGASQRGRFPLPSGFGTAWLWPLPSLCLQPSACLLPDPMWPGSTAPTQPSTVLAMEQVLPAAARACGRARACLTPAWCFRSLLLQVIPSHSSVWSLPGLLLSIRPCLPPGSQSQARCGARAAQLALSHASLEPPGKAGAETGLFPGLSLWGGSPYPPGPGLCPVEWVGRALRLLSCTPLCWLQSWESALWAGTVGYRGTEACQAHSLSHCLRILSQQSWAQAVTRVCGEGFSTGWPGLKKKKEGGRREWLWRAALQGGRRWRVEALVLLGSTHVFMTSVSRAGPGFGLWGRGVSCWGCPGRENCSPCC